MAKTVSIEFLAERGDHTGERRWYAKSGVGNSDALIWMERDCVGYNQFNEAMSILFPVDLEAGKARRFILVLELRDIEKRA